MQVQKTARVHLPPPPNYLKISLLCLLMSIFSLSAISQNLPNTLPDTGFVGVGTSTPTCNFQVIGQSQISGSLTVDSSITISDSARIDNNLRVNGHLFVGKNAYITDTTFSNVLRVHRITPSTGDSLIYLGDSTMVMNTILHNIYPNLPNQTNNKGIGIGSSYLLNAGANSVVIGHRVATQTNSNYSVVIGTGVLPNGASLVNYTPNSIMLGTNSNLPTLFLAPANGTFNSIGKVGIGTTTPGTNYIEPDYLKLDVHGDARFYRYNNPNAYIRIGQDYQNAHIDNFSEGALHINYTSGKDVHIANGPVKANLHVGNSAFINNTVGIGTTQVPYGYKLAVYGNIIAEDITVDLKSNWPDYVFSAEYKKMSIQKYADFIELHKHLPGVPSAKEVEETGIRLGEMQAKLLEKIEEQALYIIELNHELNILKQKVEKLSNK
ncbi:MAG: hypothetical protein HJHJAOHD_01504 [Flavobacteriales bacterium]|nr:hypothetical protein [Flavobacteriales bacterium]